jgi:hypothetical protein
MPLGRNGEAMMPSIMIDKRFRGPPNSGNGGYVCGLIAGHIDGSAEITLRAPPPLGQPLDIVAGADGAVELRVGETIVATGRPAQIEVSDIPAASYFEAEDAVSRTSHDESSHPLPTCFVCGPGRARGDGLRLFAGPLAARAGQKKTGIFAVSWIPDGSLAGDDGRVAPEFVWASLDCPTGYAGGAARHLGLTGTEPILLGRMSVRIDARPKPGDRCVVVAWPTGRDGRKIFADGALLGEDGEVLAVAQATWLQVDRQVQRGER